jgi:hypothetical protein
MQWIYNEIQGKIISIYILRIVLQQKICICDWTDYCYSFVFLSVWKEDFDSDVMNKLLEEDK